MLMAMPAYAQYTCYKTVEQRNGDEPLPRAILWGGLGKAHALIHYRDQHLNVVDDLRLDKEWRIKQINRDSILFARYSEKRYVEYKLESQERPKYHNDWSFYGLPITTWEAMELLADAFGHNAVMHNLACGAAKLGVHDTNAMNLLYKILPPRLRARLDGDTMYVLPIDCADGESWTAPLTRKRKYNYKALEIMYPSLKEKGILVSRGDDIQYVLRTISTGGKVPISFPKDLHFAVYCTFNKVSFSKILSDIVLINQCSIIEREKGIEIIRWPGNTNKKSEACCELQYNNCYNQNYTNYQRNSVVGNNGYYSGYDVTKPANNTVTSDPVYLDQISGSGPYPPPLYPDKGMIPDKIKNSYHPIVQQNGR